MVDGGKGQLSSAYSVLKKLGLERRIPIVGLAKRMEEIFFPNDPEPYYLSRIGEPLKVVCHIRDEAHRFGITFHRKKRSQNFIDSQLNHIEGIGLKSANALLNHFKSIEAIRKASFNELSEVVGAHRAKAILSHLNNKKQK